MPTTVVDGREQVTPTAERPLRQPLWPLAILTKLHELGAHFVLCHDNKSPMRSGYQHLRPELDELTEFADPDSPMHPSSRLLGILPASLGYSVLDVDRGNVSKLIEATRSALSVPSSKRGRWHVWYRDHKARTRVNGTWEAYGCGGEVRSTQNLILWGSAVQFLYAELVGPGYSKFPEEALVVQEQLPDFETAAKPKAGRDRHHRWGPKRRVRPADVTPGVRNSNFERMVAHVAYRTPRLGDLAEWHAHVEGVAVELWHQLDPHNREAPGRDGYPFSLREVQATARSVAKWTWINRQSFDSESQRRLAHKSAEVRGEKVRDRRARLLELRDQGLTQREMAEREGITRERVNRILRGIG